MSYTMDRTAIQYIVRYTRDQSHYKMRDKQKSFIFVRSKKGLERERESESESKRVALVIYVEAIEYNKLCHLLRQLFFKQ